MAAHFNRSDSMSRAAAQTLTLLAALAIPGAAWGAVLVLHQEPFDSDPGSTYSVLPGSSFSGASGFTSGTGNTAVDLEALVGASGGSSPSGAGSFEGSFVAQTVPFPETGTLRITDTGFLTAYSTAYPGYTTYFLGFSFYGSVLPTDLTLTIGNGTDTYLYNALPQVTTASAWNDVFVYFNSDWYGSGSSITNPLTGMTYIDLTWSRNGTNAQQFYFDDFTLFGIDDPPTAVVPEPGTGLLMFGAMMLCALKWLLSPTAHCGV